MSEKPDYDEHDIDQAEEAATEAGALHALLYGYYINPGADGTSLMDRADTDPWSSKLEDWVQEAMQRLRALADVEVEERPDIRDRARGYLDAFFARHAAEIADFETTLAEGGPEAATTPRPALG